MNECKIVQDLLPLYAEDLISPESKEFVDDHCESCVACSKLMQRCMTSIPAPEEDPKAYKTALRKNQFNLICKAVTLLVVVVIVLYIGCTKFDSYMQWKDGKAPVEAIFEAPYGNGVVTLVDWDKTGQSFGSSSTAGTLIWIKSMDVTGEFLETSYFIGEAAYAEHWENVRIYWAPNGTAFLTTADLLEGGDGIFVYASRSWYDESGGHHSVGGFQPSNQGNGIVDILSAHCKEVVDFPTGWGKINFTFLEWKEDSETLVFVFETDNYYRGVVDYHFPSDTITAWDAGLKREPGERLRTGS